MTAHRTRFWLETPRGFVAATWFWPTTSSSIHVRAAVVIVSGFAIEERTTATGLGAIAESCAERGIPAIVFDLEGVAQSADALSDPDIVSRWPEDVRVVVDHVRSLGVQRVIGIGARTGALIAGCAGADAEGGEPPMFDALVLWAPSTSGRRLARELALLQGVSNAMVSDRDDHGAPAALEIAGFAIPLHVLAGLRRFDLSRVARAPAGQILVLDAPERTHDEVAEHWRRLGARVEIALAPCTDAWLFRSVDGSDVPEADIRRVVGWVSAAAEAFPSDAVDVGLDPLPTSRTFCHHGVEITETLIGIGEDELLGVWSQPAGAEPVGEDPVRVLAAPVGPGRCFVEFARDEAAAGRSSLRFEFSGSGTSPRRPGGLWNSHYSHEGSRDMATAIEYAVNRSDKRVILIGFCSSAWSALQVGPRPDVAAVAALNVHLYVSDGARSALNVVPRSRLLRWIDRRLSPNRRAKVVHRLYRVLPTPGVPMRWADALLSSGVTVLLHFDADDPGLVYLRKRMPARWGQALRTGTLQVSTYAQLGHSLEGREDRERLMSELSEQLISVDVTLSASKQPPADQPLRPS